MHETIVYVVPVPTRVGELTGFHKCGGRFFMEEAGASAYARDKADVGEAPWPLVECVIMTRERYEDLCRACDSRPAGTP